jgi:drug/metabolite transporter (DMT)-like permease
MRPHEHWTYQVFRANPAFGRLDSGTARLNRGTPIDIATTLALVSAFGLGAGFVLTQFALKWMPPRLGAAYSVPASTVLFWCMAPFTVDVTRFDVPAAILFACVGVLFPATVALLNFESNRLMGPNIAASVGGLTPVFAVAFASIVIGESLRIESALAIAAITTGVTLMALENQRAAGPWSSWMLLLPLGAAAIRGAIQPLIKLGLVRWPDTIAAVVIGYTVSSSVLMLAALISNATVKHRCHRLGVSWWIAVGLCNGLAVFCMYAALRHGPVILVAALVSAYPLITLLLSSVFLRQEHVGLQTAAGVIATVGGITLLLISH